MSIIIDGRQLARLQEKTLAERFSVLCSPVLHLITVSATPAIEQFVRAKRSLGGRVGVQVHEHSFGSPDSFLCSGGIDFVRALPAPTVIQLPLPTELAIDSLFNAVLPEHDVDLLSRAGYQNFLSNLDSQLVPPVVYAVRECLASVFSCDTRTVLAKLCEMNVTVVGRGLLVGGPVSDWLTKHKVTHAVLTETTSAEVFVETILRSNVLILGTGVAGIIDASLVTDKTIVIDCGSAVSDGVVVGDLSPECKDIVHAHTPTPGGVGPLTVVGLFSNLANLLESYQ